MRPEHLRCGVRVNATSELIAALVAGGMDSSHAAGLVARAAVEMTGCLSRKSTGATRQQRYRERLKASQSVTRDDSEERNETSQSVTSLRSDEPSQSVTNRNESVTGDAPSINKGEKKEESKKGKRESRASSLPDGWQPDAKPWSEAVRLLGSEERALHELQKFKFHALDKGRLAKNWNAAWGRWVLQALDYGSRNGQSVSNYRADSRAGRATAREAQQVTAVGSAARRYLEEGHAARLGGSSSVGANPAGFFDPRPGAKNAH